jgi:O-6-methylguanine DNA methyltransferase
LINFSNKVFNVVKKIPKGSVLTYGEVARRAGSPKAYRVVGNILNKNYNNSIPCHRVICANGDVGGWNRGSGRKQELLKQEGALIKK